MKAIITISFLVVAGIWFAFAKPDQGAPDINKGKVVVQLNYDWNKLNSYQWKTTSGVSYYYLSIDKFPDLKSKMKIKTVPTIIVLNNGQELKRVEGGLMMRIETQQTEILK